MAWGVDDQQSWNIDWYFIEGLAFLNLFDELFRREESSTDLLGDSAGLALLDVGVADLVEQCSLAGVDVAEDAADWTSEFSLLTGEIGAVVTPFVRFLFFLFLLCLFHHMGDLLLSWLFAFLFFVLLWGLVGLF